LCFVVWNSICAVVTTESPLKQHSFPSYYAATMHILPNCRCMSSQLLESRDTITEYSAALEIAHSAGSVGPGSVSGESKGEGSGREGELKCKRHVPFCRAVYSQDARPVW
jgi:hypothetical protein